MGRHRTHKSTASRWLLPKAKASNGSVSRFLTRGAVSTSGMTQVSFGRAIEMQTVRSFLRSAISQQLPSSRFGFEVFDVGCTCRHSACEACAWALSRVVTHRILAGQPRNLISLEIDFAGTQGWKLQLRNFIDARRRDALRPANWRTISLHTWMAQDGKVRGMLTSTGPIPSDLIDAFTRRWSIRMRVVAAEEVRITIYRCIEPSVICHDSGRRAGSRLSIWPRRERAVRLRSDQWATEAMPVLIG